MTSLHESVLVASGACNDCSVPTMHVHHPDYPEAVAEGMSAAIAAEQLVNLLTR